MAMAEQENTENKQGNKTEVKKPATPKFGKPRIVVPQASRDAARSNMAGEAMVKSAVVAPAPEPAAPVLDIAPEPDNLPAENLKERQQGGTPSPNEKKARGSGRKVASVEESLPEETKNVRLIHSLWLNAKFNLVQLNGSTGPKNLTDYAEEAFRHYEKYLLSSGKINKTRTGN
jgi:hypothetical protein